ncbi:MAG: glycine cleavage system protein GcvH [Deinococcota bacterium]
METPEHLKYRDSHEWSKLDDGIITVGITDFAQDALGDVVFVELPEVGDNVSIGDSIAVVESVKTASDIYAPASGEILEVNSALEASPEQVNESPYGDGWMFKLRLSDPSQLDSMLDAATYDDVAEAE